MTFTNLTTLFGIKPASSAASTQSVNFKSSSNGAAFNFADSIELADKFSTNPIYANLTDKKKIEQIAKTNPRIRELLGSKIHVNMDVLEEMI